jgi:hypothetical protein
MIPKKGAAPRQLKHTLLMPGARLELAIIPPLAQRFWQSSGKVRVPTKEAVAFCPESDRRKIKLRRSAYKPKNY